MHEKKLKKTPWIKGEAKENKQYELRVKKKNTLKIMREPYQTIVEQIAKSDHAKNVCTEKGTSSQ